MQHARSQSLMEFIQADKSRIDECATPLRKDADRSLTPDWHHLRMLRSVA
jgi:hypothetical protein